MLVNIIDYGAGNIHSLKSALLKFLKEDQIIICKKAEEISHFLYSCFTQSTSITHSPSIGVSVIFAKFKIANIGSG